MSGFQFPPPPPPPPTSNADNSGSGNFPRSRGQDRGRGRGRGGSEFRGRGSRGNGSFSGSRGQHQSENSQALPNTSFGQQSHQRSTALRGDLDTQYGTGLPMNLPAGAYINPAFHRPQLNSGNQYEPASAPGHNPHHPSSRSNHTNGAPHDTPQRTAAGHKRKLEALRGSPPRTKQQGPPTAPSIPGFGNSILPTSNVISGQTPQGPQASTRLNKLGLTPGNEDAQYSSESDDDDDGVDEEAMHAELGENLTFEHNGTVMALNTAADLAAWREERRKQFPTKQRLAAKQEEKRQIGETRKRLLTDASRAIRGVKEAKLQSKTSTSRGKMQQVSSLKSNDSGVKKEEDASAQEGHGPGDDDKATGEALPPGGEDHVKTHDVDEQEEAPTPAVQTHTAATALNESDDDAPPEEETSSRPTGHQVKRVCKYFAASGYCRDGDMCAYKHELDPRLAASRLESREQQRHQRNTHSQEKESSVPSTKKTIFDRLVEQEQGQEEKLALQAIKYLGQVGLFA